MPSRKAMRPGWWISWIMKPCQVRSQTRWSVNAKKEVKAARVVRPGKAVSMANVRVNTRAASTEENKEVATIKRIGNQPLPEVEGAGSGPLPNLI